MFGMAIVIIGVIGFVFSVHVEGTKELSKGAFRDDN